MDVNFLWVCLLVQFWIQQQTTSNKRTTEIKLKDWSIMKMPDRMASNGRQKIVNVHL